MTVGEAVRQCRRAKEWSAKTLSEESGVSKSTITDAEYNRRCTSVAILIDLLDAMGYELIITKKTKDGEKTQKRRIAEAVIDKAL